MAYTVKELAKLSGVSVRTLHFYDETGLLKPAYYGDNGYRFYEQEQLLTLQQILFFKELDFPLVDIQRIIGSGTFDKLQTLKSHRHVLEKTASRMHELIQTIDKTIASLEGGTQMKAKEIYIGFDKAKQEEYEKYWILKGDGAKKLVAESKENTKNWKKEDYNKASRDFDLLDKKLTAAIEKNLNPAVAEVQDVVQQHYDLINRFYKTTSDGYVGLGQMYVDHPDFRKRYDSYHPKLAQFWANAMKIFAENKL